MVPPLPTGPAVAGPRPVGRVPDGRDVGAHLETSALITLGESVIAVAADLGSPNGPQEVVGRAVDELGGLDIVVNIVGIFPYRESFCLNHRRRLLSRSEHERHVDGAGLPCRCPALESKRPRLDREHRQ